MATPALEVEIAGHSVRVSNPDKVFFPTRGETKLDLVNYLAVSDGALRGVFERPTVLKRFPDGALGEPNFGEAVPEKRPEWLETVQVKFPSGRSADQLCPVDAAHLVWAVNLGCLDLNPWPVRRDDVDHPDELRVDLDPQPGVPFDAVREVAGATIDEIAYSLEPLLELAARDETEGLGDEPWPPNFPKAKGEPKRVAPSRARKATA